MTTNSEYHRKPSLPQEHNVETTTDRTDTAALIHRLAEYQLTIACAESLTGGALCARFVDSAGASHVLRGGVCAYATDLKTGLLDVSPELLEQHGPVHRDVAIEMAQNVRALLHADIGLSTTGVAGPGPADGHEAGTVHIALAWDGGYVHREYHFVGDRTHVRTQTVECVLRLLSALVEGKEISETV
ncbi:CinA family protein [Schaalia sp. lx-100]|uniref:CinA family protein n=1 Tax=Schaalia sp. lx-100 TaxID=2899081 RepID=UPI001E36B1C3|nr:CinA family protein [Schaalia sp. lx-100]MCD4557022.1 CinA family protein [Schaalia sp. lx-100]